MIPGLERSAGEGLGYPLQCSWVSFLAQLVKNPPAMWETRVQSRVGKIPWRRGTLPTPVFWPGEVHGLYSPWDRKESDRTERLSLHITLSGLCSCLGLRQAIPSPGPMALILSCLILSVVLVVVLNIQGLLMLTQRGQKSHILNVLVISDCLTALTSFYLLGKPKGRSRAFTV